MSRQHKRTEIFVCIAKVIVDESSTVSQDLLRFNTNKFYKILLESKFHWRVLDTMKEEWQKEKINADYFIYIFYTEVRKFVTIYQ